MNSLKYLFHLSIILETFHNSRFRTTRTLLHNIQSPCSYVWQIDGPSYVIPTYCHLYATNPSLIPGNLHCTRNRSASIIFRYIALRVYENYHAVNAKRVGLKLFMQVMCMGRNNFPVPASHKVKASPSPRKSWNVSIRLTYWKIIRLQNPRERDWQYLTYMIAVINFIVARAIIAIYSQRWLFPQVICDFKHRLLRTEWCQLNSNSQSPIEIMAGLYHLYCLHDVIFRTSPRKLMVSIQYDDHFIGQ